MKKNNKTAHWCLSILCLTLVLCCNKKNKLDEKIYGKWYGQKQIIVFQNSISNEELVGINKPGVEESVNFIFNQNGICKMSGKIDTVSSTYNESHSFSIGSDSTLYWGNYKPKIILLNKDSLLLYSKDLGLLRLFTRKP